MSSFCMTRIRTMEKRTSFGWTTLLHPPHSPDLAPSVYHSFGPMKEDSRSRPYANDKEMKIVVMKNFTNQGYMPLFEGRTLLLRETVTMLKSWDVIHRGPASFSCTIHVPTSVIISAPKKSLFFYSPSYIYIYIYIYIQLFGLVSLFNGISTLFRLFNAKAILLEEQLWYYLTDSWEDKGVHTFPKGICPKVNVIARLEYELAYYDSVVHRFNHYTTRRTPPIQLC